LLQIRGEAAALEDLREHVRDPLARHVRAAELGDRVVAVADEDVLVKLRGPVPLVAIERAVARRGVGGELVQVKPAQGPAVTRVAGKQCALDGFGEVDEGEDGPIEVREVRLQQGALLGGE
jgi:hypothetical protein